MADRLIRSMDPYDSAWEVELVESARVYARVGDQSGTPVIWEEDYGKGRFVVDNFGLYEKAVRGFYAASYSLLTDAGDLSCDQWLCVLSG